MSNPNVIFIMADDMGWGDIGCYGATKIPTPNMDLLASQGVRLTDAHSSSAVCTPSRYSVLTGRYCWRSRLESGVMYGFGAPLIEPERMTVASLLKGHAYRTASVGKWHLGFEWTRDDGSLISDQDGLADDWNYEGFDVDYSVPLKGGPSALGFDYNFNISASLDMPPYCFIENDNTVGIPTDEKDPYNPQQRKGPMTEGWSDDKVDVTFARKAVGFIERHAESDPDRPFFLYMTPSAPHRPCVPPDFMAGKSQAGLRGDMVCVVDWMVGEVMDALDRLGLTDDTLLVLTSDNGARATCYDGNDYGHMANGSWRGQKADIWDGGHREPFVARWPGRIEPGSTDDTTVCLADLFATCAEIVGENMPDDAAEDSFTFLPALLGDTGATRPDIVHHSVNGMFSLREGRWKMIQGLGSGGFTQPANVDPEPGGPEGQLYDMDADPAEADNLWDKHPEVVERLSARLAQYVSADRSRL